MNKLLSLIILFLILPIYSFSQIVKESQEKIEFKIHELTKEHVIKIDSEKNALKKVRLQNDYGTEMQKIFNESNKYQFGAKVWSVDFDNESSSLILRLASLNKASDRIFFYNFKFGLNGSKLSDLIAELKKGDIVKFTFTFLDTVSLDSDYFRGFPLEKNPDTGNYVYLLFIDLQEIVVS